MGAAILEVLQAGPHVTFQDGGRPGLMRFGVPASGPMDRSSFAIANAALGNPLGALGVEASLGGISLRCREGAVTVGLAGGGFIASLDGRRFGSWSVVTLREGQALSVRSGFWGAWTYLAFAGTVQAPRWLDSASTHARSNLGGGRLGAGDLLTVADAEVRDERVGPIPCPVSARPRPVVNVVLGPQDRFFSDDAIKTFLSQPFRLTDGFDRMGVRLRGPSLAPNAALDMPSEPIVRGSIQIAGDGVATVLLADHQTTGGYPKIATVASSDLDAFAQNRPNQFVAFVAVPPERAVEITRSRRNAFKHYIELISRSRGRSACSGPV